MTTVNIDLKNIGNGTNTIDKVIFYSPVYRDGANSGEMVSTAEQHVYLVNGVGTVNLAPGPVRVRFAVRGIADTVPKEGIVPNDGPVELAKVLENDMTYTPPVVSAVIAARDVTLQAKADTIAAKDEANSARDAAEAASNRLETAEKIEQWVTDAAASADRAEQATAGKADKVHTHTSAQISDATHNTTALMVVKRDENGTFLVPAPTVDGSPTPKNYVDNKTWTSSQISDATSQATPNTVVKRGETGDITVNTPTYDAHPTTKSYVDTGIADVYADMHQRPALFSGAGNPPSSIPGAVVGDFWLDTTKMELRKIIGV